VVVKVRGCTALHDYRGLGQHVDGVLGLDRTARPAHGVGVDVASPSSHLKNC
jgi:hypothetical protein